LILSIGPIFTNSYGDVGGVCWIVNTNTVNIAWRYIQVYFWLIVSVIYCACVWVAISRRLKNLASDDNVGLDNERRAITAKSVWYPLILVITRFPGLIERIADTIAHKSYFWLTVWHNVFGNSNGWLNAIVYGMTPIIVFRIKQDISSCCSSNFGIGSLNTQGDDTGDTQLDDRGFDSERGDIKSSSVTEPYVVETVSETPARVSVDHGSVRTVTPHSNPHINGVLENDGF